jgi:putative iron-regulated protein
MSSKNGIRFSLSVLALSFLGTPACSSGGTDDGAGGAGGGGGFSEETARQAADTYADIVSASYKDTLDLAVALDAAIQDLATEPSETTLAAARSAWLAAREPYLQTEVYRFYSGPIDNPDDGPEGRLNAWPLDEAYIDYVEGDEGAGIINDPDVEISKEGLASLNEQGGEKNIATGYHAIEFLLWGQDHSDDGPGERPASDYSTAENADRRALYLVTVSELLLDDLEFLVDAWAEDEDNYRAEWDDLSGRDALKNALTGMLKLTGTETGGERIETALESGSQEDEHSCFSDNTHRDMIQDVQGVKNVWYGTYSGDSGDISGPGIRDAVAEVDEDLAADVDDLLEQALDNANALEPPFDQEIKLNNPEGHERVQTLATSLRALAHQFEDVFRALELDVPTEG